MPMFLRRITITTTYLALLALSFTSIAPHAVAQDNNTQLDASAIQLPDNYRIEPLVAGLSVPTTAIFDGNDLLVAESGFLNTAKPRVLRIKPDGTVTVIVSEGLLSPVTGLLVHEGKIYVSHRTKVSVIENNGLRDIVTDLPSQGDHQNNQLALGPDGKIYLSQGTTTNSAVVGEDNHIFGWLKDRPEIHEVPCKDITLNGHNFETGNPLTEENDQVTTGAYKPFGTPSQTGEVIKGNIKCGGSIIRFNPDGSGLELVAWGLRNPFGLSFDSQDQLWATSHGTDVRGSRSINNDPDYLIRVEQDAWYGWPDFFDGQAVTQSRFNALGQPAPPQLIKNPPPLAMPFTTFDSHAAANGFAFAPQEFGFGGQIFVAMYGSFAPLTTGLNVAPVGYNIVRVNPTDKTQEIFASNKLPGPAYLNRQGGFNRPSDVVFGPDQAMYIVDWGAATLTENGLELVPGSGAIWRIYPANGQALRPDGPIMVSADLSTDEPREPIVPNIGATYKAVLLQWLWVIIPVLIIIAGVIYWARKRPAQS